MIDVVLCWYVVGVRWKLMKLGLVILILLMFLLCGSVLISVCVSVCGLLCVVLVSSIVVLVVKLLWLWVFGCLIMKFGGRELVGRVLLVCKVLMFWLIRVWRRFFMRFVVRMSGGIVYFSVDVCVYVD